MTTGNLPPNIPGRQNYPGVNQRVLLCSADYLEVYDWDDQARDINGNLMSHDVSGLPVAVEDIVHSDHETAEGIPKYPYWNHLTRQWDVMEENEGETDQCYDTEGYTMDSHVPFSVTLCSKFFNLPEWAGPLPPIQDGYDLDDLNSAGLVIFHEMIHLTAGHRDTHPPGEEGEICKALTNFKGSC